MSRIDRDWIAKKINDRRGVQAELAKHLGITNDKMAKTMAGSRRVQPEEIPLIVGFFRERGELDTADYAAIGVAAPNQFSEPEGQFGRSTDAMHRGEGLPTAYDHPGDQALRDVVAGKVRNRAGDPPGSRQVAVVNGVIQIAATIGPDDVDDLIEELQDARRMAERHLRRQDRNTE